MTLTGQDQSNIEHIELCQLGQTTTKNVIKFYASLLRASILLARIGGYKIFSDELYNLMNMKLNDNVIDCYLSLIASEKILSYLLSHIALEKRLQTSEDRMRLYC